jgi:hypothetical protein
MYKFLSAILLMMLLCSTTNAQKLVKNQRDKFTQAVVKQTSKEKIWRNTALGGLIDVYAQSSNGAVSLWLVMHVSDVFGVVKGDPLYIALNNGGSVELKCISGTVAKAGENLWHGTVGYTVEPQDIDALIHVGATGIRVQTVSGYIEKNIKEKHQAVIGACIKLVTE